MAQLSYTNQLKGNNSALNVIGGLLDLQVGFQSR